MVQQESYGRRLTTLAAQHGDATAAWLAAVDDEETAISWRELESWSNRTARLLAARGVGQDDLVVLGIPNSLEHLAASFGAWKLGAPVLSLRWDLPAWERDRLLGVAGGKVVVADWEDVEGAVRSADVRAADGDDSPLPDRVAAYSRLVASSGSTGTPKIIVTPKPAVYDPADPASQAVGDAGSVTLGASPLYHTNGFASCYPPLLAGQQVVLMERFDAARAVELIERYRVTATILVPTMLQRIARLPDIDSRDLSSLQRVVYGGASLPEWVARKWLSLIPPERFQIMYGGSELIGMTVCTGRDWLERPGTVGPPVGCEILILDEDRRPLPPREVGQIWMRRLDTTEEPFRYVGVDTPQPILDGYRTFGDMGYLDEDGWLYIADRRQDMIISGGANVFPAEVEAALSDHPAVNDVVVIGVPDPEWGHRVHAVVEPTDAADPPDPEQLRAWAKERLAPYKVPKTVEYVERMPRTAAGKVNRTRLAEERTPSTT